LTASPPYASSMPPPTDTVPKGRPRPIRYLSAQVQRTTASDGSIRLKSSRELDPYDPSLANLFRAAAARAPDRIFLAERSTEGWRTLTYSQARKLVDSIAASLLDRRLSAERPVLILSGNSIEHALVTLAGYTAGIPVAPVSVAYSLQSHDHGKLKYIVELLTPGLIYVSDTGPFGKALAAIENYKIETVALKNTSNIGTVTSFERLTETPPGRLVEAAVAQINEGTVAKFLFTSGSTDLPKAVVNSHGMLTSNQQSLAQIWPFLEEQELVLVDWLPWSHTFGGNHNFHLVIRHSGSLYIDAGKPTPDLIQHTVRNLAEISPTIYFNVPAGFAALLPFFEKDVVLARNFFGRLRLIFYAGAGLPQDLWSRLETISVRSTGNRVPMTSSWGATETAPAVTAAHFPIERAGNIGVPMPGVDLKLLQDGERWEVRVKGPNVTPGYWRSPQLTAAAFDAEGFYKTGDAVRFADPTDAARGLIYDGRVAEDFKLTTGTWVRVGALRVGVLAAASPVLQDAVIAGEGSDHVRILAWLNVAGCRQMLGDSAPTTYTELVQHPGIHERIANALQSWNSQNGGQSTRIRSVLLLCDPPSIDANEITDKGYINQRAVLANRKSELERLFGSKRHSDTVIIEH